MPSEEDYLMLLEEDIVDRHPMSLEEDIVFGGNTKICVGCGEEYDLKDPTFEEVPLECCGECGGQYFVQKSCFAEKGFQSFEHYVIFWELLPSCIKDSLID